MGVSSTQSAVRANTHLFLALLTVGDRAVLEGDHTLPVRDTLTVEEARSRSRDLARPELIRTTQLAIVANARFLRTRSVVRDTRVLERIDGALMRNGAAIENAALWPVDVAGRVAIGTGEMSVLTNSRFAHTRFAEGNARVLKSRAAVAFIEGFPIEFAMKRRRLFERADWVRLARCI